MLGPVSRPVTGFLIQRLAGDPTLVSLGVPAARVVDDYMPQDTLPGTEPPLIVVTLMSAIPINGLPATVTIQNEMLFQVEAVHESKSKATVAAIADRFHTLLVDYGGVAPGGLIQVGRFYWVREGSRTEVTATGQTFKHVWCHYGTITCAV